MRTITVNVTQKNIDAGCQHSAISCPVALALRDCGPQFSYLVTSVSLINIHNERVAFLPEEAREFICRFDQEFVARRSDHEFSVKPFTFEVTFNS
jgi:hypothetical protein